jgi:ArsR family transcriptional regulator
MMKTKDAVRALGALAQETRLAIFRLLVGEGPDGLPAGQIAERLGVPAATMSFHLMQLSHAGLIVSRRESRLIIYAVNVEGMNALLQFLTEDCCRGRPELCLPNSGACAPNPVAVISEISEPKGSARRRARAAR